MRGRRYTALPKLWSALRLRAAAMRRTPTAAERVMWEALRNRRFRGFKFRRQHPVGPYIADFICVERHLVIEVDGLIHVRTAEQDAARVLELEALGPRIFRCSNEAVLADLPGVLKRLTEFTSRQP